MGTQFGAYMRALSEEKGVAEEALYAETSKRGIEPGEAKAVYEGQQPGNMRYAAAVMAILPFLTQTELSDMLHALNADEDEWAEEEARQAG